MNRKCKGLGEENVTKYGEFVCSMYQWLPLDKQKEDAEEFEQLTNSNMKEEEKKRDNE